MPDDTGHSAVLGVERRVVHVHAQHPPVAAANVELALPGVPERERLHDLLGLSLAPRGHDQLRDRPADRLLRRIAVETLRRLVPGHDQAVPIRLDAGGVRRPVRGAIRSRRPVH